ncbi:hypothetical protein [Planctopirus hydrillae]|uniref:Uncharacterized protein n=1 Tax=Planctopirus hydrillae TaxID=1841610 RepID=A0A1C3EQC0_9PLAN|nr:hypothetical protein [Planctopirus hydrillae]ODA35435.1 hypothetical protein A6X21_16595 [Planctopirus hydrillae]
MNTQHDDIAQQLAAVFLRLDVIMKPWGFAFIAEEIRSSHCGPFASGFYCRDTTRIGISCRTTIDNIFYEHFFITRSAGSTELERFTIGHSTLMDALGYASDCHLIASSKTPDTIIARDGGDRVEALIHDLSVLASRVLCEPCEEFYAIVRRGLRKYSVV